MANQECSEPIESASIDELRALQRQRLRWSLRHAYDHVAHYRQVFDAVGVRPEDLGIDTLVARVAGGEIDEVVLAMNATLDGQTTAHYLVERLESHPVRITQLAHGLPVGGELDYLDDGTLMAALKARRKI